MAAPPFDAGAEKISFMLRSPGIRRSSDGASGTVAWGVASALAEAKLDPSLLAAVTEQVTAWSLVNEPTMIGLAVPTTLRTVLPSVQLAV